MSENVDAFLARLKRRDPEQPEFHQAVEEVLRSLWPFLEANPHYRDAGILERMADVVQLIGMVAVVVEHIGQQRQHLFVAHRLAAGVLMAVRVAVMRMIVIVFMFVHGKHSFLSRAGLPCGKITLL